jgi:hypothetical protein
MYFQAGVHIRQFCCKKCSDKFKEKQYNSPETGPVMPHLKAENITDEGYIALVKAVVSRASHDVTHFKPGTQVRIQAEKFFESEYFATLTGLDGHAVLRDLLNQGKKKKPDKSVAKPKNKGRPVQCIETGVVYGSIKEAAIACNLHQKCIQSVCMKRRNMTGGFHWRYVEEDEQNDAE